MPDSNFRLLIALFVSVAAVSCRQDAEVPAHVDVYDGFEMTDLGKAWSRDRFEPGAVQMQTDVVRAGKSAARVVLQSRDKFEAGQHGNKDTERAELLEAHKLISQEDVTYEQSFSMFLPTDFPLVPTRLVIAQWKQFCPEGGNCSDDSPILALRFSDGVLRITHQVAAGKTTLFETKDELRGQWLEFKFQTRFSTNDTGRIQAWLNGKQVVDYTGVNAYPENATTSYPHPGRFYFKMGLYRDLMSEPMTIYIDEYRKKQL